jgi:hypothetical protein
MQMSARLSANMVTKSCPCGVGVNFERGRMESDS